MYLDNMRGIPSRTLQIVGNHCEALIRLLCREMERYGYDFLSDIPEDEYSDLSDANGWEYYEDGSVYY